MVYPDRVCGLFVHYRSLVMAYRKRRSLRSRRRASRRRSRTRGRSKLMRTPRPGRVGYRL